MGDGAARAEAGDEVLLWSGASGRQRVRRERPHLQSHARCPAHLQCRQRERREMIDRSDMIFSMTVEAEAHQGRQNWAVSRGPRMFTAAPWSTALDEPEALGINARTSSRDMVMLSGRTHRVRLGLSGDTRGLVALAVYVVARGGDQSRPTHGGS